MKNIFIPPVILVLSILLIVLSYFFFKGTILIPFPFNLAGIIVSLAGFIIMGKARELFAIYKTNLSIERSSALIKEGVFSKSRNPMYSGMLLLILGIAICFGNIYSLCFPVLFFTIIRFYFIPIEEMLMKESFGQGYLDYMKNTRMWI